MKPRLVQCYRLGILAGILWLVHEQHEWLDAQATASPIDLAEVKEFFPGAVALGPVVPGHGERPVYDGKSVRVGFVVRTSPQGDKVVGYPGPTDCLFAFDEGGKVAGMRLLESGDTPEHVEMILEDEFFLGSYDGMSWDEVAASGEEAKLDGVSGATLTSLAIREAVALRFAGRRPNLRFPEAVDIEEGRKIFPEAASLATDEKFSDTLRVLDGEGETIGLLLRTGYLADEIKGYQGPTDTLIGLSPDGETIAGIRMRRSYDTRDYVKDVEIDRRFFRKFAGLPVAKLTGVSWVEEVGIEGVSGATMTSYAMAEGVLKALKDFEGEQERLRVSSGMRIAGGDWGLFAVIVCGIVMTFSGLRRVTWLRRVYQVVLVLWLGFWSGDMVTQALTMGWAQSSGVAWRTAPALVALVAAAFVLPIATGRQVYCHHVCPHGAAQQLLMRVAPVRWRITIPRRLGLFLERCVPSGLLGVVLVVGMTGWALNLAGIEPFDAYLFRTAGWASLTIFGVSLVVSAFVPMAYCRFGCPTGRLLEFARFRRGGEHFGAREMWGGIFLLAALGLYFGRNWVLG